MTSAWIDMRNLENIEYPSRTNNSALRHTLRWLRVRRNGGVNGLGTRGELCCSGRGGRKDGTWAIDDAKSQTLYAFGRRT